MGGQVKNESAFKKERDDFILGIFGESIGDQDKPVDEIAKEKLRNLRSEIEKLKV